jgi:glucan phosphoethanolaminetransferase (alkaline phosphatase superfamily)
MLSPSPGPAVEGGSDVLTQLQLAPRGRLGALTRLLGRRAAGWLLVAPTGFVLLADLARRGERVVDFAGWHRWTYLGAVVESVLVWGVLLLGAAGKGAGAWLCRALFAVSFVLSSGGQGYFFQQYNTYLSVDVSVFAGRYVGSVLGQLAADLPNYVGVSWLPALFAVALLVGAPRVLATPAALQRKARFAGPLLLIAACFVPTHYRHAQASTPDVLYLHAAGGLLRARLGWSAEAAAERPMHRRPRDVPALTSQPPLPRNVLLVILESARADAVCVDYDPDCRFTPASNALLPERIPLRQMRALDSSTAISLAVLWTGIGPHESREVLHTWPSLFEYARAAGWHSAFWTSQNLLFGNSRLWVEGLPVQSHFSATDLDPESDLDLGAPEQLLAERAVAELPKLREPFLAVVQLSNGHAPYLVDPALPQPFQPASTSKAPEDTAQLLNHYRNALHQQDLHLARLLRAVRSTPQGRRTVVLYTSDHGEAFREHSQSGHTFSVFDEEIKVPAWIDAPPGTLTELERRHLLLKRDAFTFHPDLTATVLDLMGVWDDPGIGGFRERFVGTSLLRPEPNRRAVPLTNCAGVWSCAYENWGYMREGKKLLARAWDPEWQCFDLRTDPAERRDLGPAGCGDLRQRAEETFLRLPGPKDGRRP